MMSISTARDRAKTIDDSFAERSAQKRTLASAAYDHLCRDVVHGVLKPGDKLRFNQLVESYGFGVSTLREALTRMMGDGLVVLEDQRGFTVSPVSREQLLDLLQMRLLLEEQAIRLSIERGGVEWEVGVMSAFHRLFKADGAGDDPRLTEDWERCHADFHRALLAGCGSPLLLQMRETLFRQGERYRRLYQKYVARERDHLGEHRLIMEAAQRRDADETVRLVTAHLRKTVEDVLHSDFIREPAEAKTPDAERG
jgi:DNA-binding GntR family transcriptional regulator